MKSMLYITIILCGLFSSIESAPSNGGKRLQLTINKHQPCVSRSPPSERIRFSSWAKAPLIPDPQREGCYTIQGPVAVKKQIQGNVQIYVEAKSGVKSPIEKCSGADGQNCGGFGSCVYCDVCAGMKEIEKTTSGFLRVEMGQGKSFDCENGLNPGNYTDIKISFCMPTKSEFLEAEQIGEDVWKAGEGGHQFMMTMYLFNKAINTLSSSELSRIATDTSDQVIGCHKLVGSISEGSD